MIDRDAALNSLAEDLNVLLGMTLGLMANIQDPEMSKRCSRVFNAFCDSLELARVAFDAEHTLRVPLTYLKSK